MSYVLMWYVVFSDRAVNTKFSIMWCPSEQDRIPVMRGQWFIDGTWLPLEEDESDLIELEHLTCYRGQQMKDTYEMEAATTTVDSKDGEDAETGVWMKGDPERCVCVWQRG